MPAAPIYVRVIEAPAQFGVSRRTIYRWAEDGAIRIYRRGNCAFLKIADVSAWIEEGRRADA